MKNILIIEPSTSGLNLLPTAKKMGLNTFVLTADKDERIIPQSCQPFIFKKIIVDTHRLDEMAKIILQIHRDYYLSAIIPGFEIFVSYAAFLSHLIHLPGLSPEAGKALRNKSIMRTALLENHVRSVSNVILQEEHDIKKIAAELKFPVVIKPIDQSGSMHVSKVNNTNELLTTYHTLSADPWTEMGKGIGSVALVEEYVNGEEFSVEGYVDSGGIHIISVTKKILGEEPFFVEMGHIVPANLDSDTKENIAKYVNEVIHAVKLTMGVFHCEIRIDKNGPVLMEIAGRLPGDKICNLILLSSGIDMWEIMILSHMGLSVEINPNPIQQYAGIHFFCLEGKNTFHTVHGVENVQALPGFQEFTLIKQPGEFIPPAINFLGRIAYCIFTAPTYKALEKRLDQATTMIKFS